MTEAKEEKVREFLTVSSGYGSGYGDGSGSGYGSGDGSGITMFNGMTVHQVDCVQTVITAVRGNLARGYILRGDLTLQPCRIAKVGDKFAHGETTQKALDAAREKLFDDMSEEERIAAFWDAHVAGVKYPARDFFDWHHRLTGSCEMGRNEFCRGHGIDLENGMYTVEEFVAMTRDSYGGAVVARLMEDRNEGKAD